MKPPYAAHTPPPGTEGWQGLAQHTEAVASLARGFGQPLGLGDLAYAAGLLHDAGKYSDEFQQYLDECHRAALSGTKPPRKGLDHKTAGTLLAGDLFPPLAVALLGHHGGMPKAADVQPRLQDSASTPAVQQAVGRARQALASYTLPDGGKLLAEAEAHGVAPLDADLLLRMLFSCLVDADWLDTEHHFTPGDAEQRRGYPPLADLWRQLEADQKTLVQDADDTPVNRVRREVYEDCLRAASLPPGVFKLTVPTGGGKTRSSLAFALQHALTHGLERVLYAIPYTSIIEQTAGVFRGIFPDPRAVLEHHSAFEPPETEDEGEWWRQLASENWDAPLIVTTTVQLFESLFAARPGRCRKVHHVTRSVIILDEVQTLPVPLLAPILDMLRNLVARYGVSVVLCTATQPALEGESRYLKGLPAAREIVPDHEAHFRALERVSYHIENEPWTWERAADVMKESTQCLAVLNTRKNALALLGALDDDDALHLSTLLCSAHRREVLKEVRERLENNRPCRLVSTQVVEAGVDLDFPLVLRAVGPLDRIVQAAGRCNREGKLDRGRVVVFTPAEGGTPRGPYAAALAIAGQILREPGLDLHSPALFTRYFARLFQDVNTDAAGIQHEREERRFPAVAEKFRLIDEDTVPVLVPYDRQGLKKLVASIEAARRVSRDAWRRARQWSVSVRRRDFNRWLADGAVSEVIPESGLYQWHGAYDRVRGLGDTVPDPADLCV